MSRTWRQNIFVRHEFFLSYLHPSHSSKRMMDEKNPPESELHTKLMQLHSASFAWAMACCRNRETAEEVLQTVYLKVLGSHARHNGSSSFRTWLFSVIRNAAIDQQRKRSKARVENFDSNSLPDQASSSVNQLDLERDDELIQIRQAMADLPDRQREIAHLVFYEDLTVSDAAQVMGVSKGTASQHYARAKETLRRSLKTFVESKQ